MGSLMVAGAIEGLGGGMKENVVNRVEDRRRDEDKAHDMQVENMRQQFQRGMAKDEQTFRSSECAQTREFESEQAEALREFTAGESEEQRKHETSLEAGKYDFLGWKTNVDNESNEWQAMMGGYIRAMGTGAKGTKGKAGDWDVEFAEQMDPETGVFSTKMLASHPNGTSVQQIGNRMVDSDQTDEERTLSLKEWADPNAQAAAEFKLKNDLESGNDSAEQFRAKFKYLPAWYFRMKYEQDNKSTLEGLSQFMQRSRPSYQGPNPPRSTPERMQEDRNTIPPAQPIAQTGGRLTQGGQLTHPGPLNEQGVPVVQTDQRSRADKLATVM
jgi:hypothetical protein